MAGRSADARQRIADEHVDDPAAAEGGVEQHEALGLGADLADDRGLARRADARAARASASSAASAATTATSLPSFAT